MTINLTGLKFGDWSVISYAGPSKGSGSLWKCRCECGTKRLIKSWSLRAGITKSCGSCHRHNSHLVTHGATKGSKKTGKPRDRAYISWAKIKQRCHNPNCPEYKWYGAKGIKMYLPWRRDYARFLADMGPCPPGHVIGRICHWKDYRPGNCKWVTRKENSRETNKGYRPPGWKNKGKEHSIL